MRIHKKIDFFQCFLYLLFAIAAFCLSHIGNNAEPFSLSLVFALSSAGISPTACAFLHIFVGAAHWNLPIFCLYTGQALLLLSGFLIQNKLDKNDFLKTGILPMLTLSINLGLFIGISPFTPYELSFFSELAFNPLAQKVIIAAALFLLAATFSVGLRALLKKFLKCRLRNDEIVFCLLFFVLTGIGFCRFFGLNAYMGVAFFILLLFACAVKDSSVLLCSFALSIPPFFVAGLSLERFFVYGVFVALFIKSGRLAAACSLLLVFFSYGYFDGLYAFPSNQLVSAVLTALLPSLFFILIPTPLIRELENKLLFYREKHLSRIAINRNRNAVGEQLFEISSVFREIQATFSSLGTNEAEEGAKEYIRSCVLTEVCHACPQYEVCKQKGLFFALDRLIDVGCLKGKSNLIDLPKELADACVNQSGILYSVNRQIGDYRKYMLEAENAASGRALLAKQAQGVSEILKNLALEQSEPLRIYAEKERALSLSLLRVGIVCSEILIYGEEDNPTLSLITFGKSDVKKIAAVTSHLFGYSMIISERLVLSHDKFCCILRKKPYFDAAFGVSSTLKKGQNASGDTHSVIKIDERRFMVALSDGMGSGEYARKISESTISLLESFYRAKMPSELILSTVNKLLAFNKEETFACVDVAIVNLDSGLADVVKIGSPLGFILSGNTVRVLENSSLPLGILDTFHPDSATYELSENDVLLFLSDGIVDAFPSVTDLYDLLRTLPLRNPQQLTDCILERALQAYGGIAKDDMTALAVRLFKNLSVE